MSVFTMSQHQYVYAASQAPRQYSAQGTSSAFSSSANPDEDWTQISDLAERRRIQNRIAQRNYRKKLKRRLEDLERRAGSEGSTANGVEKQGQAANKSTKKQSPAKVQKPTSAQQPKPVPAPQFTPPISHEEEFAFTSAYDDRERSHTPPFMTYSAYPPPDELMVTPYGAAAPFHHPMTTADAYPTYMATTVPCTLPSMTHFSDAIKRETFAPEESLSPYMTYGFIHGMDMTANSNPYDNSNPHTPPLSHSFGDHSANCSDSGYDYPHTPLSIASPHSPEYH